jgi:mRNA-degrading endonuclease RelE of RelBE toxin-antitoxin system
MIGSASVLEKPKKSSLSRIQMLDDETDCRALLEPRESLALRYRCQQTVEFTKVFHKLDKNAQKLIDKAIQEILVLQPYESKRLVSPEFRGKRSLRTGDYRIIFAVCEECRALGEVHVNKCENCYEHRTSDVILFVCGHRKHIYDT